MTSPKSTRLLPFLSIALAGSLACAGTPGASDAPGPASAAVSGSAATAQAVQTITEEDVFERVSFLASDEMRGRDTPSPELERAAEYLVEEHRRFGLQPGGEDGYFQRYPLRAVALDTTSAHFGHILADGSEDQLLTYGEDFFILPGGTGEGVGMSDARIVYVGQLPGDGLPAGEYVGTLPVVTVPGSLGRQWQIEVNRARAVAREAGAAAVAVVVSEEFPEPIFSRLAASAWGARSRVVGEPDAQQIPIFVLKPSAFGAIAEREGFNPGAAAAGVPARFEQVTAHFAGRSAIVEESFPPNVVAVLPGSDPELRDEYIVLSAHFDHVGVGEPVNGDSIYNGADDNASGTVGLLEVAEALASLPESERPRRSVAFLHVSGEELGLLGSQYYADHPTLPMEQTIANINLDMISRNHPDSIVVIGKDYSTLGAVADEIQQRHPEVGLVLADDIWPEERFFFRSDHFHFARKEVPALFFFSGVHEDYHQPSDEVEKIDTGKVVRIAQMIFHLVREIADNPERPQWDPEGLAEVRALTQ